MEFWIYFWIYSFSLIVIWAFFIIAKIHSLKFKNYQPKIAWYTKIITILLSILTILWYILIFFNTWSVNTSKVKDENEDKWKIEKQIDDFSDISEKDENIPNWAGVDFY